MTTDTLPRRIPVATSTCQLCKRPILWARFAAGPNGASRVLPVDPVEAAGGNVAARPRSNAVLVARFLAGDESHDHVVEYRARLHADTCPKPAPGTDQMTLDLDAGANVIDFAKAARRYRRRTQGDKP